MMSGMPLETCWAFNKLWNNKFYYKVASCWLFLLIKLKVCLFVPYTNSHSRTKLCTHLPLRLEETEGYVWSKNVWPFLPSRPSSSGASAESLALNGCRRKSSSTALYPWFLLVLVWCHGNDVADDSFMFLLEVSCTMGNAYKTRRSERNACIMRRWIIIQHIKHDNHTASHSQDMLSLNLSYSFTFHCLRIHCYSLSRNSFRSRNWIRLSWILLQAHCFCFYWIVCWKWSHHYG